jgi:hypothetical protein
MASDTNKAEYIRACKLPERFPNLSSVTAWKGFLSRGLIPSFKPPESRARVVRVADVVAFLEGHRAGAAA